ncbi:ankyrin repeat domain-containing protein, partial [Legionella feeleii]
MSDTLRKAAVYDKLEIVQYLCSLESNNKPDSEAVREALIGAASRGKLKIVQYLCSLESNNKPDSKA